ncbi:MAG TPA: NAD(P)H-dependent oxidoreductase [Patescibacteria group bacterium]
MTLIIYAHPPVEGFCSHILKEIQDDLDCRKIKYEVIDLYKIDYDPVLKTNELYTAGNREISQQNLKFQEKIKTADKLILIYPVWWNSSPAIIKGFFDRVMTPRFAYKFYKKFGIGYPVKLLKGKKAAVFQTSGSNKLITLVINRNRAKKITPRDILGFSGIKARVFHLGRANRLTDDKLVEIKKLVKKGLNWLY